jgi:hypothetical protein
MPISNLDPKALKRLNASEVANLALAADQERRRLEKLGDIEGAAKWGAETNRLAAVFRGT